MATEVSGVLKQTQDWGSWDDTYAYVKDHNSHYASVNLTDSLFDTTHVDLLCIVDQQGHIIFGKSRLPNGKVQDAFDPTTAKAIAMSSPSHPALNAQAALSGVIEFSHEPLALAVRPILDSAQKLRPRGAIFMGRFLSKSKIHELSQGVRVPFDLVRLTDSNLGVLSAQERLQFKRDGTLASPTIAESKIIGLHTVSNVTGPPAYFVRSATTCDILQDGIGAVNTLGNSLTLFAALALTLSLLTVNLMVTWPLKRLTATLDKIGTECGVEIDAGYLKRSDEIGSLARSFAGVLTRLSLVRDKLVHVSREAGMAEVARGVLHNAGNVLTSVTVSVHNVRNIVEHSKLSRLEKTVDLLKAESHNLALFFEQDPRGQKLVPYLSELSTQLESERSKLTAEAESMTVCLEHLKQIVSAQNALAFKPDQLITVNLSNVLNSAVDMVQKAFERHHISVQVEIVEEIAVSCDQSKMLQVIVNVLTNAKQALQDQDFDHRNISVRLFTEADGQAIITITDSGEGILESDLKRIFHQGFTTKSKGTGFGLHYCANALAEMGWSISATSAGKGTGTTITIRQNRIESMMEAA